MYIKSTNYTKVTIIPQIYLTITQVSDSTDVDYESKP